MANTNVIGKEYASRANAVRAAKKNFGNEWGRTVEIVERNGKFIIAAVETETVVKMNKRLDGVEKAQPTPKMPKGSPRQKGAVAELWEAFGELQSKGYRRVDILDTLVAEGYNYWTVRTQLQAFTKAQKGETTPAKKSKAKKSK